VLKLVELALSFSAPTVVAGALVVVGLYELATQ